MSLRHPIPTLQATVSCEFLGGLNLKGEDSIDKQKVRKLKQKNL